MEHETLWKAALAEIELTIPRASFVTWFKNTSIAGVAGGTVVISVPNGFAKEWLQDKYNKFVVRALRNAGGESVKEISYVVGKGASSELLKTKEKQRYQPRVVPVMPLVDELQLKGATIDLETGLNARYTFASFVVGSFNELANAAAQAIIKSPGSTYNPLFICGGVGLGKTHLIQAIGNELAKRRAGFKVRYITSEKYMGEIVDALARQAMGQLKERYRSVDLLIMDDIQFIARTEKMQEEFFHTFNVLHQLNKQIVISSDRPPSAIPTLESRLRSRFEGGMIADIGEPDFETRLTILKTKTEERNVPLPEESLKYIALTIKNNIRELEGALNRLVLHINMTSLPPTIEETKKILSYVAQAPKNFSSPKKVVRAVADFYEMSERDLVNQSRRKEIVRPRQIAMFLLREELKCSFPFIGERLGKKDHTTAIHAFKKIEGELKSNSDLQHEVKLIKDKIYSS